MYEQRPSLYACVDHYWRMTSHEDSAYPQSASVQWGLVFVEDASGASARLVGPRTKPVATPYEKGQTYWAIVLHGHIGLAHMAKADILNKNIPLSMVDKTAFRLGADTFQIPEYGELDMFVSKLLGHGALTDNQTVSALTDNRAAMSTRTKQRKYKIATGLTPKQIEQANRVAAALELLEKDLPLADIALQASFADQAHMTREFKALVGRTPAQIRAYYKS